MSSTTRKPRKPNKSAEAICKECMGVWSAKWTGAKYCSAKCRVKAFRDRKRTKSLGQADTSSALS